MASASTVPVFVMSPGRTGTTLVMKILASSDDVWVPGEYPLEERLIGYLSALVHIGIDPLGGRSLAKAATESDVATTTARFADHVRQVRFPNHVDVDSLAGGMLAALWDIVVASRIHSTRYYAEKSVGLELPLGVDSLDHRVIHVIRDPRDIVVSVREFNRARGFAGFGREMDQSDISYASRLMGMYRRMLTDALDGPSARPERELAVRYEDLVAQPDRGAARLGSWLDVPLRGGAEVSPAGDHATSESPEASIGRWRAELHEDAKALFDRELGEVLGRSGYES